MWQGLRFMESMVLCIYEKEMKRIPCSFFPHHPPTLYVPLLSHSFLFLPHLACHVDPLDRQRVSHGRKEGAAVWSVKVVSGVVDCWRCTSLWITCQLKAALTWETPSEIASGVALKKVSSKLHMSYNAHNSQEGWDGKNDSALVRWKFMS